MFLKIMRSKMVTPSHPMPEGEKNEPEKVNDSTEIINCEKINFFEGEYEGVGFTAFVTNQNKSTERVIRINHDDYPMCSVYIMNEQGKTIQQPV